jgi:hypothetical protein
MSDQLVYTAGMRTGTRYSLLVPRKPGIGLLGAPICDICGQPHVCDAAGEMRTGFRPHAYCRYCRAAVAVRHRNGGSHAAS